ncbi:hypothetical protein OS493_006167 [Desmophyllum pertusum]|uniref:Uncharacterized protein n=1 Tax=Desmophyllum pertusum TaxID=174260 RepID=A0A9X0A5J8_9CNID|nr:hypothetical protein OS493_006167 [Desmophyllum pertusum]
MPVGQNGSGACVGVGKDSTVDQSVHDLSTQSNEWQRLGARPRDRAPMKRFPVEPSLVDLVPQEVAGPVAHGLAGAFLARHSQDESLNQGSVEQVLSDDSSSQEASYVEPDCQVAARSDAHRRSWFVAGANTEVNLEPHGAEAAVHVPSANSGGSVLNRGSGTDTVQSTDNSLLALEQRVEEALVKECSRRENFLEEK